MRRHILTGVLGAPKPPLMCDAQDARMTTTTALILNGILAAGLLAALGYVMSTGHRLATSRAKRVADWPSSIEPRAGRTAANGDFKRAA